MTNINVFTDNRRVFMGGNLTQLRQCNVTDYNLLYEIKTVYGAGLNIYRPLGN
jgi:hypothetical protein